MRLTRPVRVRPPWRSSESWSLSVSKVDSIHWRMPPSEPKRGCSSLRSGRRSWPPSAATCCSNSAPAKPLSAITVWPGCEHALEQFGGDDALGRVRGRELEADRQPVGRAEQVEAEAPEPAAVRAAVAVAAEAGQRGAADGLAGGGARHRGRVEQPQPVAERRREPRQQRDRLQQLRRQRPQPLVEAGLAGDVRETGARAAACASRRKRRSFGQSSSTCATARQISSLSEIRGGRPERAVWPAGDHRPARKGTSARRRGRRTQSASLVDGVWTPPTSAPHCRSLRLRNQSSSSAPLA